MVAGAFNVPTRTFTRPPGGIVSVADVRDEPSNRLLMGVSPDPVICEVPSYFPGTFCPPGGEDRYTKEFAGLEDISTATGNGGGFVTYQGVKCFLNGGSMVEEANAAFEAGESRAVDRAFQEVLLQPNADSLVSGGSLQEVLAIVEAKVADIPGQAILHMSRYTAVMLGSHIRYDDDFNLFTRQGTPINNGLNYGTDGGSTRIYVTGPVTLWRGAEVRNNVTQHEVNQALALVERPWAALYDCFAGYSEVAT
jgi:hypothetical protein